MDDYKKHLWKVNVDGPHLVNTMKPFVGIQEAVLCAKRYGLEDDDYDVAKVFGTPDDWVELDHDRQARLAKRTPLAPAGAKEKGE